VFAFVEGRSEFILEFYSGVFIYFYYFLAGDEAVDFIFFILYIIKFMLTKNFPAFFCSL
jgi:hypothetical protein